MPARPFTDFAAPINTLHGMADFLRRTGTVEEPTSDRPDRPARPKFARALTASIRRHGDKGTLLGRIVTAGLAIVLTCALATGIGALLAHTKSAADKNPSAAARHSPRTSPSALVKTLAPSRAPRMYVPVPGGPVP